LGINMGLWYIGNTSVRSALRIRDGLIALNDSKRDGDLRQKDGDKFFRDLLGQAGVVSLGNDKTYSVGRKWRSVLGKLGFLYPEIHKNTGIKQEEIGKADTITPNGYRLIAADSLPAQQECYLRAMLGERFLSRDKKTFFCPLIIFLEIMTRVEKITGSSALSFPELSIFPEIADGTDNIEKIVADLLAFRKERDNSKNKKHFDKLAYDKLAPGNRVKPHTFIDYGDSNKRYLKATGLVSGKGKGIVITPEQRQMVDMILASFSVKTDERDYLSTLCNGYPLPTDSKQNGLSNLGELAALLKENGVDVEVTSNSQTSIQNINQERFKLEESLHRLREERFAQQQRQSWQEIAKILHELNGDQKHISSEEDDVSFGSSEEPAYLEWSVWRAFLALDNLKNKPFECRRFNVDQDLLPIGTAPGNGSDLVMDYGQEKLLVEVTLTENDRQLVAESEPVRRHVAEATTESSSDVFGLFIAKKVNANVADDFYHGYWYDSQSEMRPAKIIPISISQFVSIFSYMFNRRKDRPGFFIDLLSECWNAREGCHGAVEWKKRIDDAIAQTILEE
jgi:hypothetical protein